MMKLLLLVAVVATALTAGCVATGREYHEGKIVEVKYLQTGDTQVIFSDGFTLVLCRYQALSLNKTVNLTFCRLSGADCYSLDSNGRVCGLG
jgi:hypothetical protein